MTQVQQMPRYWSQYISAVGFLNPCFMLPQLYQIWATGAANDISLFTLGLLTLIQGSFSLHGHFTGDQTIKYSNFGATVVTLATAAPTIYFQS